MKEQFDVVALYKFAAFPTYQDWREKIKKAMEDHGIKGSLLIAHEGINGTIAGKHEGMEKLLEFLRTIPEIGEFTYKTSYAEKMPFYRTKVKLKKEICTMGVEDLDPRTDAGIYVDPKDWNALITDPDVMLVDTRNDYEVQIGTFRGAIDPDIKTFREFPELLTKLVEEKKPKKVAMFCTGGIRCEKSTSFLNKQGFDQVYHLKGGILKYFEEVPAEESLWDGECFVFDGRVAVKHGLAVGSYDQCFACRMPITKEDKESEKYERGISCPHCFGTKTDEQMARLHARAEQIERAHMRGIDHVGGEVKTQAEQLRAQKKARREAARAASLAKQKAAQAQAE